VTAPGTWASADPMTAARLNTELRDQFIRLYGPPRCHAYQDAASPQSLTSSTTLVVLTLTKTSFDASYSGPTLLAAGNRLTLPIAGLYLVTTALQIDEAATSTSNQRVLNIRRNSNNAPAGGTSHILRNRAGNASGWAFSSNPTEQTAAKLVPCNANDHLQFFVSQNSGATKSVLAGQQHTFLEAIWVRTLPAGTP